MSSPKRITCALARVRLRSATADRDGGFALVYSVLLMMVILALSVAVLALMLNQVKPTQFARKNAQTLDNSQAGFEATLNLLRGSTDTNGAGNLGRLPVCPGGSDHATVTGTVGSTSDRYSVDVYYLLDNPAGLDLTGVKARAMACSPLAAQPRFAYLVSAGSAPGLPGVGSQVGNRTLHASYQFSTDNTNVTGGRIRDYAADFCWDVGGVPTAGTSVQLRPCLAQGTAAQSFIYRPDLTIYYAGDPSTDLCVDVNPPSNGTAVTLAACASDGQGGHTYPYVSVAAQRQEWSLNDTGHFEGAGGGGGLSGLCLVPSTGTPFTDPTRLQLDGCDGNVSGSQAFNPDPSAGAGAATGLIDGRPGPNGQLVNYQEFGRCFDITGQNRYASYEIDYPCKQAPNPNNVRWNQRFSFTATTSGGSIGTLSTVPDGVSVPWCITAPNDAAAPVRLFECQGDQLGASNGNAYQQWQLTGAIASDYDNSFNLKNGALCMSLHAPQAGTSNFDGTFSTVYMEVCNGSDRQKWNAPAGNLRTLLSGVGEDRDH